METEKLLEVRMKCLGEEQAQEVIDRCGEVPEERRGKNAVRREGDTVIISYNNKMWPYDIADMAGELELASDEDSARVFACI